MGNPVVHFDIIGSDPERLGVPDVEAALQQAEALGGKRVLGPERSPGTTLAIGHFTDPEGTLIGVAGVG